MRSQTITTTSKPKQLLDRRLVALGLTVCALAIPAAASAYPADPPAAQVAAVSNQPSDSGYATVSSLTPPTSQVSSTAASQSGSDYSTVSSLTGGHNVQPGQSSVASTSSDNFDWGDAAFGAGIAMALIALASGALVLRRRTTLTPSA